MQTLHDHQFFRRIFEFCWQHRQFLACAQCGQYKRLVCILLPHTFSFLEHTLLFKCCSSIYVDNHLPGEIGNYLRHMPIEKRPLKWAPAVLHPPSENSNEIWHHCSKGDVSRKVFIIKSFCISNSSVQVKVSITDELVSIGRF